MDEQKYLKWAMLFVDIQNIFISILWCVSVIVITGVMYTLSKLQILSLLFLIFSSMYGLVLFFQKRSEHVYGKVMNKFRNTGGENKNG